MKRIYIMWLLVVIVLFIGGCNTNMDNQSNISIVTTIQPLFVHTKNIVWDKITLDNLIPAWTDIHSWQPTPQSIALMEDADMVIINWLWLEEMLDWYFETLESKSIKIVDSSININDVSEYNDEGNILKDPHVWLDPDHSKQQVEAILSWVIQLDPSNKAYYEENARKYVEKLDALENDMRSEFEKLLNVREFIVFHNAYNYYFRHYWIDNLNVASIEEFEWDSLTVSELTNLIEIMKTDKVNIIITEPGYSPKIIETLEHELWYRLFIIAISPIWLDLDEDWYIKNMKHITDTIISVINNSFDQLSDSLPLELTE